MRIYTGPGAREHGTYSQYGNGCRCEPCRTYQNERNARNRADRKAAGRFTHGTRSAYDAGCRCESCKAARHEAYIRLDSEIWWDEVTA